VCPRQCALLCVDTGCSNTGHTHARTRQLLAYTCIHVHKPVKLGPGLLQCVSLQSCSHCPGAQRTRVCTWQCALLCNGSRCSYVGHIQACMFICVPTCFLDCCIECQCSAVHIVLGAQGTRVCPGQCALLCSVTCCIDPGHTHACTHLEPDQPVKQDLCAGVRIVQVSCMLSVHVCFLFNAGGDTATAAGS
jgi:hypothetical protein